MPVDPHMLQRLRDLLIGPSIDRDDGKSCECHLVMSELLPARYFTAAVIGLAEVGNWGMVHPGFLADACLVTRP